MNERKEPDKLMADKNNDLTSAQEVLYQKEFNKADGIIKDEKQRQCNKEK